MSNRRVYYTLQIGRLVFIFMIVFFHIGSIYNFPGNDSLKMKYVYEYGGVVGNVYFFMSSGFLITSAYKEKIIANDIAYVSFISRRLKKLFPIYVITNIILIVYSYCINGISAISLDRVLRTFLFVQSGWKKAEFPYNGVCWFVNVLVLLYTFFYFSCYLTKISRNRNLFTYLSLGLLILGYLIHGEGCKLPFLTWMNAQGYISFAMGILIFEFTESFFEHEKIYKKIALLLLSVLFGVTFYMNKKIGLEAFYGDYKLIIMVVIMPLILYIMITCHKLNSFSKKIYRKIDISMQLCFWHLPVMYWLMYITTKCKVKNRFEVYLCVLLLICYFDRYLSSKALCKICAMLKKQERI